MQDLSEKFKEYLEQAEVVKTLNADLKDAVQSHESYQELEKLKKEAKRIKDNIDNVTEIALIREKRDGAKERQGLLKDILLAEMNEAGQTEVTFNGKKAKLIPAMKFTKE
jgi:predicted nucleotide-binding protein (sugar kinase/HSP70/actin superfamily)